MMIRLKLQVQVQVTSIYSDYSIALSLVQKFLDTITCENNTTMHKSLIWLLGNKSSERQQLEISEVIQQEPDQGKFTISISTSQ